MVGHSWSTFETPLAAYDSVCPIALTLLFCLSASRVLSRSPSNTMQSLVMRRFRNDWHAGVVFERAAVELGRLALQTLTLLERSCPTWTSPAGWRKLSLASPGGDSGFSPSNSCREPVSTLGAPFPP